MNSYVRDDIDLSFINRIAVLPFENNSSDKYAASRIRNIAITQILSLGLADVIDKGLVDSVILEEAVEANKPIDQMTLKRLGQRLNVQAFLMGNVDSSGTVRRGSMTFPSAALTLRFVDARAAKILWQASGYYSGETVMNRLFGLSPGDHFQISTTLVRGLLMTYPAPPPEARQKEVEKDL
ncbi:MAG: hypothetical protein KKA70_12660 [Proteobacteria bacterium]|nr:hypothetical protein [Pseudomonadota bacterium]